MRKRGNCVGRMQSLPASVRDDERSATRFRPPRILSRHRGKRLDNLQEAEQERETGNAAKHNPPKPFRPRSPVGIVRVGVVHGRFRIEFLLPSMLRDTIKAFLSSQVKLPVHQRR